MESDTQSPNPSVPQMKPMKTPLPTWLRPMTGLFSIVAGVLYGFAAMLVWGFQRTIVAESTKQGGDYRSETIQNNVDRGLSLEDATTQVDAGIAFANSVASNTSFLFTLFMALFGCCAMLIAVSGVGLLKKKVWSLSLGQMSCVGMILAVIAFFIAHHSSIHQISVDIKTETEYGAFAAIRFVFLMCMSPVALIMGYALVVKQIKQNAAQASATTEAE